MDFVRYKDSAVRDI